MSRVVLRLGDDEDLVCDFDYGSELEDEAPLAILGLPDDATAGQVVAAFHEKVRELPSSRMGFRRLEASKNIALARIARGR